MKDEAAQASAAEQGKEADRGAIRQELVMLLGPMLIAAGALTYFIGGDWATVMPIWLAYPLAFLVGCVIAVGGAFVIAEGGGTLVELGCGGMIACMLILILCPVFQQARDKVRAKSCLQHQRILGTALLQYRLDYDDTLPPARVWADASVAYLPSDKGKRRSTSVLVCPAASKLSFGYVFHTPSEIENRSEPLLYDSRQGHRNAWDTAAFASLPRQPRHRGKDAVLYADGHVALRKRPRPAPSGPRLPLYAADR